MPENDPQPGELWSSRELFLVRSIDHPTRGEATIHLQTSTGIEANMSLDRFLAIHDYAYPNDFVNQESHQGQPNVEHPTRVLQVEQAVQQTLGRLSPQRLETVRRIIRERLEAQRLAREARPIAHRVTHSNDPEDNDYVDDRVPPEELDGYTDEELEETGFHEPYFEDDLTTEGYEAFHAFHNSAVKKTGPTPPPTQWDRISRDEDD